MKISTVALLAGAVTFGANAEMVEINHAKGTTKVETNPERVVVLGLGALDTVETFGISPVAISTVSQFPDYLSKYRDGNFVVAGSLSEPDFETIYTQKPDLIIIGSRAITQYDELNKIAPTIVYAADANKGYWPSTQEQWRNLAKIFEKQDFVEQKIEQLDAQFKAISQHNKETNNDALTVMSAGGNVTTFGSQSRFSAIYKDFGFNQTVDGISESKHGDLISYEFIREANPETLLIIDKDKLINKGTSNTKREFDNELVQATSAFKNNRIVYLDINAWYLSISGIQATEQMIQDVKTSVNM
ncbi:siderophore ABC transporter substrate-binding protein [Vibrio sinensis]|uniref:Siderophore ABC transporter substrate-binding protein n=1 Tax=Vibrio sinensis TaxID=2302434 RepID=A0A3A6QR71_9VIBR|nr:siderophore ABC transporter substrate-binding protein [Vibrio sinensis]RJX75420.1 siderophore ABC transporter substrate-binding protein [Vibrio sinensis]